jgi:CRISPR-associated protein Cas1
MAWRGLHLSQPARLWLADNQVVIARDADEVRLPLEDLAWMVFDTPQISLTAALLSACMEAGVAIISTDAAHLPNGVALPFHRHFRQADVARRQMAMSEPLRKRLWQRLIRRKIENQAAALTAAERQGAEPLRHMVALVGSGDPDNVEARAARAYWGQFFADFRREDETDRRNGLLNYGYAVVRSLLARDLVAAGLLPAFGLQHASVTNAFNLADDLIEPFRPFVDVLAYRTAGDGRGGSEPLTLDDRRTMAGVLFANCRLGGDTVTLMTAGERAAESLVRAMDGQTPALLEVPELVP